MTPWRDRAGRFSALKLAVFVALFAPALWVAWQWQEGMLGPRTLNEAIHQIGLWATRLLLVALAVTPARSLFRWPEAMQLRRMTGVAVFLYVALHLLLYAADMKWRLGIVVSEIASRIYLTIGFAALAILAALAATSFDRAVKALGGARWRRLHRGVYAAGVLVMVHAALQSKADVSEAMLMSGLFLWLMGWRLLKRWERTGPAALVGLSVVAAALTALIEAGWYAFGTGIDARLVLAANLDVSFGLRPALWVGLAGLAVTAASWLRHRVAPPPRRRERRAAMLAADA